MRRRSNRLTDELPARRGYFEGGRHETGPPERQSNPIDLIRISSPRLANYGLRNGRLVKAS